MTDKLFGTCWACGHELELVQNIGVQRPARLPFIAKHKLITKAIENEGDSLGLGSAVLHCPNCTSERIYNQIFCPECAKRGIQTPCKLVKHTSIVDKKTYITIQCENYASFNDKEHGLVSKYKCNFALNILKGDGRTIAEEWKLINGMYGLLTDWEGSLKRLIWYYDCIERNSTIADYYRQML